MDNFEDIVFMGLNKNKVRVAVKAQGAKIEIPNITPAKLKSQMYNVISKYNSIYKDNSWEYIHKMTAGLEKILPNLALIEAKYRHDDMGVPNGKRWTYAGVIEDNKKNKYVVIADVSAHGAGSVEDPLDRYDITCVVNTLRPRQVTDPDILDYLTQFDMSKKASVAAGPTKMEVGKIYRYLQQSNTTLYFYMVGRISGGVSKGIPFGVLWALDGKYPEITPLGYKEGTWNYDFNNREVPPLEAKKYFSTLPSGVANKIKSLISQAEKQFKSEEEKLKKLLTLEEKRMIGEGSSKQAMNNSQETNRVINYLSKNKEAMNYIDEDENMDTGEDFMFAFENAIKDDWKNPSFKWNRVDWEAVKDHFLG